MKANPDFRERVDRADERINKMLAEYLEKKDREANEETQSAKRPRLEASGTATGSRDPLPQQETERDAEMGVPEAGVEGEIAGSKRTLQAPETEGGHGRRQILAHLDTGHRGQVIGELHRKERVLPGSSVAVELCQFSIDEERVDAVSRKKWDFSKEEERAKFLANVDRRGRPVLWVHFRSWRRADSTQLSVAACTHQNRRRRFYVLQVPLDCNVDEKKELSKLLGEANGKMCSMKSGTV